VCVGGTTGSGRDESDEPPVSGRALAGVRGRKPLVRLGLAPQLEGAPQEQPTFLVAIPLDQLLDARKLCRKDARKLCRSIDVWRNHSISVWETSRPRCPLLDSADRLQQSHLCREVRMVHEPLAELRSTAAVHGGAPLVAVDGDVDTRWAPGWRAAAFMTGASAGGSSSQRRCARTTHRPKTAAVPSCSTPTLFSFGRHANAAGS
jgi:hypothetical protein